ncbi:MULTISPECIES: response regulator [Tsukamurella]|uniref:Response regulator transcription factor n=2 Tax=Tsukamurella TaxID=2060 RepID=A0A5C5S2T4_9ACTN|nr:MULTISPECIES: response regulator transcription factor [Tsukamurella]NMD54702.1 response regulator transcription factor [Tsukamurella columbiensis]TWS28611.1 response regulator transcription factor [Tsukamurella conjunctivitidis]
MSSVLIVDDQRLIRDGLRMLLTAAPDFTVAGEATNGEEAARAYRELTPDVVLMDLRMPGVDGVRGIEQIIAADPAARIVVLTTFDDDEHMYPALAAGAVGFLVKDIAPEALLDNLRRALDGEVPMSPGPARRVLGEALRARTTASSPSVQEPAVPFTERENDVLTLVAEGLSNAAIAGRLHVAESTVKAHIANLRQKTGAGSRVELARFAARD